MKNLELKNLNLNELTLAQTKEINGGNISLYDQIMFLFNNSPDNATTTWYPCGENGYTAWCTYK